MAKKTKIHESSIRCVVVESDETSIFCGSSDRGISRTDAERCRVSWRAKEAHSAAVNCVHHNAISLCSGDDEGCVKCWDVRSSKSIVEFPTVCQDYVSAIGGNPVRPNELLLTSGDGTICILDQRTNKILAKSDDQEDELLAFSFIKEGSKVVVGTQEGALLIFSQGRWQDQSDRFPGHPDSVNAVVAIDEDTVLTGAGDGLIRLVSVQPNRLLGIVGDHDDFPIETLRTSTDRRRLGSSSHDNSIKIWDIAYFWDDAEEEDAESNSTTATARVSKKRDAPEAASLSETVTKERGKKGDGGLASGRSKKRQRQADFFAGL